MNSSTLQIGRARYVTLSAALLALALLGACSSSDAPAGPSNGIVVFNAMTDSMHVTLDGGASVTIAPETTMTLPADAAWHTIIATHGTSQSTASVRPPIDGIALVEAHVRPSGLFSASAVVDTGSIPAPGTSKLRVMHLASSDTAVDIWRIQPDFGSPVRIMFPFNYEAISPYIQSQPGTWTVIVTPRIETWPPLSSRSPRDHAIAQLSVSTIANQAVTVAFVDDPAGGVKVVLVQ